MRALWLLFGITTLLVLGVSLAPAVPAAEAGAETAPSDVPEVFTAGRCNLCHSIESHGVDRRSKSEKTKGPDLSDVGSRHSAEWMASWLRQEETLDGETHEREYKGSDEELKALVDWLATLKESSG